MNVHGLRSARHSVAKFTPRCEHLEDRQLLSVTITEHHGTLIVAGDANDSVVRIMDNGTSAAGNILVNLDGRAAQVSTNAIRRILVMTGGGTDQVEYHLEGDLGAGVSRGLGVFLGQGDDAFTADFGGHAVNGAFALAVDGGNGANHLSVDAKNVAIGAEGRLAMGLIGGRDADAISLDYSGVVNGRLTVGVLGGGWFGSSFFGNRKAVRVGDTIATNLDLGTGSVGSVKAGVAGSAGNDNLTFNVTGDTSKLKAFKAVLFTGRGTDVVATTDNVIVKTPKSGSNESPPVVVI